MLSPASPLIPADLVCGVVHKMSRAEADWANQQDESGDENIMAFAMQYITVPVFIILDYISIH